MQGTFRTKLKTFSLPVLVNKEANPAIHAAVHHLPARARAGFSARGLYISCRVSELFPPAEVFRRAQLQLFVLRGDLVVRRRQVTSGWLLLQNLL